jgi:PAS domain S-box-containing protein
VRSREVTEETRLLEERLTGLSRATLAFAEAATDLPRLLDIVGRRVADATDATCMVQLLADESADAIACHGGLETIVPLRARDRAIGQLVLARVAGRAPFDAQDHAMARILADHAAVAISNAQLLAEASREPSESKRLAARLRILAGASHEFSAATEDYHLLLDIVARRLGESLGDMCAIRAITEDGEWLESSGGAFHRDPALLDATRTVMSSGRQRVGEGLSGRVVASGKPFVTARIDPAEFAVSSEPRYQPLLERLAVTSAITLPLICRGRVVGLANLMRSGGDPYDDDDVRFAQSVADHAAFAIANARSYVAERVARERAEQATRAVATAESRFAQLFDSALIGMITNSLDGPVVDVNDALLRIVGYSRDELLSGRVNWRDLTPEEWRDVDAKALDQLTRTGIGQLREKEYVHKGGRRVPVLVGSVMLEGGRNECISVVLDLTERKDAQAAIEHLRREQTADQQRAQLAAIVDASADAIIGKTLAGIVTSWNPGAQRLFGYLPEEVVGRSISLIVPPGREAEETAILEALAKGETKHFDTVRRRKDGSDLDVSVTTSPICNVAGQVIGISKVARDITHRKRVEDALARAKDAAEAASGELEAFSYSVAHDLRAPLRGMNAFARLLLESYGEKFDADGQDWLNEILLNAKRMADLIEALLSLSRVSRSELSSESVNLSSIVRTLLAQLSADEPGRAVEVVIQDQLRAELDPRLARALVDNLVRNAWKFTSKLQAARIEFGANEVDGARAFYVRDNGAGFDMAYAQRLFAPFQRLHARTEFPGTGIGLATVQRILHRHGGRIWAEGAVNGGATFYFSIPSGRAQEAT